MQFFPGQVLLVHCLFLDFSPSWGGWILLGACFPRQGPAMGLAPLLEGIPDGEALSVFRGWWVDRPPPSEGWMIDGYNDMYCITYYYRYMIYIYMGVSKNRGTPKSSILIGFSIINHPFWGTPIFGNIHIYLYMLQRWGGNPLHFMVLYPPPVVWVVVEVLVVVIVVEVEVVVTVLVQSSTLVLMI